jgi:hypothetical protein
MTSKAGMKPAFVMLGDGIVGVYPRVRYCVETITVPVALGVVISVRPG